MKEHGEIEHAIKGREAKYITFTKVRRMKHRRLTRADIIRPEQSLKTGEAHPWSVLGIGLENVPVLAQDLTCSFDGEFAQV